MSNPFAVVKQFEQALCDYTGAPYCVTTTSCTMALLLAVKWHLHKYAGTVLFGGKKTANEIEDYVRDELSRGFPKTRSQIQIPKRTYVGVPMSILNAGARVCFRDEAWQGAYRLEPLPIWDSARRFRRNMYDQVGAWGDGAWSPMETEMVCLSFHWAKVLGIEQGGAILHADPAADAWLRKARFDGRTEGVPAAQDKIDVLGYHAYMSPETAAQGLVRLALLKGNEPDLPNDPYPDLSQLEIFR